MIRVKTDASDFEKDILGLVQYSLGFLDGAERGKPQFLKVIGAEVVESLKQFVDSNARVDPQMLHHVYEWYQTGSPNARLFDISYLATDMGLSFGYTFRQSQSVASGSKVPFYDKANIMENGIPVKIKPVRAQSLAFDVNGEMVFTKSEVTVNNPGGEEVVGSFEKTLDMFFNQYFSQSFLDILGISNNLINPKEFNQGLGSGKMVNRASGIRSGYQWIARAGDVI